MTHVVSICLRDDQLDRLKRFARRMGKSQSEMGAQFIEESMRDAEFANIEFRDSVLGRQPYMKDSNLAVWEVIMVAQDHDMDAERVATYFDLPCAWPLPLPLASSQGEGQLGAYRMQAYLPAPLCTKIRSAMRIDAVRVCFGPSK